MGWDEWGEQAEDRQSSESSLHKRVDYPFLLTYMKIRDEYGNLIGTLIIEELIALELTAIKDGVIRAAMSFDFKQMREMADPFPDEDELH